MNLVKIVVLGMIAGGLVGLILPVVLILFGSWLASFLAIFF